MLEVRHLSAGYGPAAVLHDVSLDVGPGEIVALIGPNTAGKSSLLRTISRQRTIRKAPASARSASRAPPKG